jgi:N6-adenosine-specific RNA methylase IME4
VPFLEHNEMSWQEWRRGKHSAKPERFYDTVERVSPGPFLELFARRQRPDWVCWGNEIDRDLFYAEAS